MLSNSPNHAGPGRPAFLTDRLALFDSRDFVTAIYLMCEGYEPELRLVRPGLVEFTFLETDDLRRALTAYRRGDARVSPTAFHACQVELRARMAEVLG